MDSGIGVIASLVFSLAEVFVPVAVLLVLFALLNRRDRHQARVFSLVAGQFSGEVLRSDIVIEVRSALLAGSAMVRVDIRHDGGQVWPAIERLGRTLPPRVRLVVTGAPQPDRMAHLLPDVAPSEAHAKLAVAGGSADWEGRGKNGTAAACMSTRV
jgi:hypothetical protein